MKDTVFLDVPAMDQRRIPGDLWQSIALLIPEHQNTHRFGGDRAPYSPPRVHGGHPLRPPHRLLVEGPQRHPLLPEFHRPQPLPGVVGGGCLPEDVFTLHIPAKGKESRKVKRRARAKARRWAVERTHSWMNRCRGTLLRWSKKPANYIALLHLAFAFLIYGRMALSG